MLAVCQCDENIELINTSGFEMRNATALNEGTPTISHDNNNTVIHPNCSMRYLSGARYKRRDKSKKFKEL